MVDARLLALTEALLPPGQVISGPDHAALVAQVSGYLRQVPGAQSALRLALSALDTRYFLSHRCRFHTAPLADRRAFLQRQQGLSARLMQLLSLPLRAAYLVNEETRQQAGGRTIQVPSQIEHARWRQQVTPAAELEGFTELEADVVVIGTGAGGAAAAYELASAGLAVVMVEEGEYYDRRDFNGRLTDVIPKLYRASGATLAVGNGLIPIPVGRSVGGTTTINSGTCLRTPDSVLQQWVQSGLSGFEPAAMEPWFQQVEAMLQVQPAQAQYVGEIGDVIATGARRIGLQQVHTLQRNAVGCDGQGLCQFGCPTDAKQSTNVSYVPRALERGAFLMTGLKAQRLLWDGCQVTGLESEGSHAGLVKRVRIRARRVIVAAGTLFTPLFLQQNGIRHPWLGHNLSIHPCGVVSGVYPDRRFEHEHRIPQGFGVTDLAAEGILFEGGTPPFAAHGLLNPFLGGDYLDFLEQWQNTGYFGFMIRDSSRGRVGRGLHPDVPLIRYRMNRQDQALFQRGLLLLAKMHLRAGAESVYLPGFHRLPRIYNEQQLHALFERPPKPWQLAVTAYHPLGTARVAAAPDQGVCDSDHRVYGRTGLYVMDGSAIPSSLGANPQVTIMAMALKAANTLSTTI